MITGPGITVLVVDDDESMRELLALILRKDGYRAIKACGGAEALEMAAHDPPDLIVTDCNMPEMDGFEVCREFRSRSGFEDVPIIFLTALASSEDKTRAFSAGGVDFVTKPVDRTEFVARVRTHLELAKNRAALRRQAELLSDVLAAQMTRFDQVRCGQESLLTKPSAMPELNLGVRFQPAFEAGGDFYDFARIGDGEFDVLVADVAGHDLSVVYLTGGLKALFLGLAGQGLGVAQSVTSLNTTLRRFLPYGMYATACYARFSRPRSEVQIACAGHPAVLVQRASGDIGFVEAEGDVLGVHESIVCEVRTLPASPGDRFFLYTDGLIESGSLAGRRNWSRQLGSRQLLERIAARQGESLQTVTDAVVDELIDECNGVVEDDIVLVGVEL